MGVQATRQSNHAENDLTGRVLSCTEKKTALSVSPCCCKEQIRFYPRARAHSSLLACYHAIGSIGVALPQFITVLQTLVQREKNKQLLTFQEKSTPLDVQLASSLYPAGKCAALVSDSTVSMVEAILRHLQVLQNTYVFLPGILLYPHFYLLELFEKWGLRVVGYDVDFVTMCADVNDIRKKALAVGLPINSRKNKSDFVAAGAKCSLIIFLIGVYGRFLTNAKSLVEVARSELCAFTVELHPITGAKLVQPCNEVGFLQADVHITCMDFAGEIGGAVAFCTDPLLAHGIYSRLKENCLPATRKRFAILLRHALHVIFSDGISFNLLLYVVHLWSQIANAGQSKERYTSTVSYADKIFEFLMASQVENFCGNVLGNKYDADKGFKNKNDDCANCDSKGVMPKIKSLISFSQPHRSALVWMINAIKTMRACAENDCIAFWEFLGSLDKNVEVVSAGEPSNPWGCVASHCDCLLLRVHSPGAAANVLRSAGFDASPAIIRVWNGGSSGKNNSGVTKSRVHSSTLREIVILSNCPQCAVLAEHALFLPLYKEIKLKNRQRLRYKLLNIFSSSCFMSPSKEFKQHVLRSPFHQAYRSKELDSLIFMWRQRCKNVEAFFAEPQPRLLWVLLGPFPGYLFSRL